MRWWWRGRRRRGIRRRARSDSRRVVSLGRTGLRPVASCRPCHVGGRISAGTRVLGNPLASPSNPALPGRRFAVRAPVAIHTRIKRILRHVVAQEPRHSITAHIGERHLHAAVGAGPEEPAARFAGGREDLELQMREHADACVPRSPHDVPTLHPPAFAEARTARHEVPIGCPRPIVVLNHNVVPAAVRASRVRPPRASAVRAIGLHVHHDAAPSGHHRRADGQDEVERVYPVVATGLAQLTQPVVALPNPTGQARSIRQVVLPTRSGWGGWPGASRAARHQADGRPEETGRTVTRTLPSAALHDRCPALCKTAPNRAACPAPVLAR